VVLGYLSVDTAGYGAIQLTENSRPLLRGEIELPLRRDFLVARMTKVRKAERKVTIVDVEDSDLWEALRECRKRLADDNNVPPYVIFHDAALMQLAADKPQTSASFLEISGVGQTKLERYGPAFMAVVRLADG